MQGMLAPEEVEEAVGTLEVREIFRASKIGMIAGCYVTDGQDHPRREGAPRARRHGRLRRRDRLAAALQRRRARGATGFECGIVLRDYIDVKEGDVIEVYATRQVERTLS